MTNSDIDGNKRFSFKAKNKAKLMKFISRKAYSNANNGIQPK